MTLAELCSDIAQFFTAQLSAAPVAPGSLSSLDGAINSAANCLIAQGETTVGEWSSHRDPTATDPTEGETGYQRRTVGADPVWMLDRGSPTGIVEFVTRVGDWNATLLVLEPATRNGILSNADTDAASRFLVETTTKLTALPNE
ncbi:hypothetical protein [Nocardia harenae]|uniref:hypothetical protein n=1 Tax=Nocardia harenae TaxID=358707 RepID=UPI0008336B30|nr:hypothetical protein [Nocardia harenae]